MNNQGDNSNPLSKIPPPRVTFNRLSWNFWRQYKLPIKFEGDHNSTCQPQRRPFTSSAHEPGRRERAHNCQLAPNARRVHAGAGAVCSVKALACEMIAHEHTHRQIKCGKFCLIFFHFVRYYSIAARTARVVQSSRTPPVVPPEHHFFSRWSLPAPPAVGKFARSGNTLSNQQGCNETCSSKRARE